MVGKTIEEVQKAMPRSMILWQFPSDAPFVAWHWLTIDWQRSNIEQVVFNNNPTFLPTYLPTYLPSDMLVGQEVNLGR